MTTLFGIERWLTSQPKTASASGFPDESWDLRTLACTEDRTSAHLAIATDYVELKELKPAIVSDTGLGSKAGALHGRSWTSSR